MNLDAILFEGGFPSGLMLGAWRAKGALQHLQPTVALVDDKGLGTDDFRRVWRIAFPDRLPLIDEQIATEDGRATIEFWRRFE